MSTAAIVTGGYGTPGSASLVVTGGYTAGAAVVTVVGSQYLLEAVALDIPHMLTDTAMGWAEVFTVGGAGPYYGIFDDESIEYGSREKDSPTLLVQATDAASWTQGQAVVIRSLTYYIAGLQPDGLGVVRLILEPPQ